MNRKSMIAMIICFAFVSTTVGVIATHTTPITWNGTGTATVSNAGPSITGTAINDGITWVSYLDVDTEYDFYVNVSDANTLDDISRITLEMWVTGNEAADNPTYRYKFQYQETLTGDGIIAGAWTQILPTIGAYLNNAACTTPAVPSANSGSYVFAPTMFLTAKAGTWNYNATVTDGSAIKVTALSKTFSVYKYLEMTYDAGGGSQNFAWAAAIGTLNVADTFDVTVTSNTGYSLSAAYENRFYNVSTGEQWANEPSIEVKYGGASMVTLTNATSSYAQWTSFGSPVLAQTTTHTMYLDFESVLPSLVYTGVTIYIRASV